MPTLQVPGLTARGRGLERNRHVHTWCYLKSDDQGTPLCGKDVHEAKQEGPPR